MLTLVVMLALLVIPYAVLSAFTRSGRLTMPASRRGLVGLALMFAFTGVGHFVQTEPMAEMLPSALPWRVGIIYATGVLELVFAAALLVPRLSRAAAWCIIIFLVLALPANVHAAMGRVPMGAHAMGPIYLLARVPVQVFIGWWAYYFGIRQSRRDEHEGRTADDRRPSHATRHAGS